MRTNVHRHLRNGRTLSYGGQDGITMIEILIAAFLIIIVFFGLTQYYTRGRTHLNYEEDRRKATAVAEDRIDGIRRDFRYDDLSGLDGSDTTYVVDDRSYTVSHVVTPNDPEDQATTLDLTVAWTAKVGGSDVSRSLNVTTILGRGMP
jgi:type II secretory pathway pseudopilin PulG